MALDTALKMKKVNLELFTNEDMYTFIERSIRGGVSQISKRYAKANNKQCHDYDPLKPITLNLSGCKQFVWMGYVPMLTYKRIWMSHSIINQKAKHQRSC